MHSTDSRLILPEPNDELKRHSAELHNRICAEILSDGAMPFSRYMEMALYEPGLGYYSAGLHKLGEAGDFVTAPELGNIFARCLARQVDQAAFELTAYEILEVGAGTGQLASDLLAALVENPPARYRILERSGDLRRVQRDKLLREHPGWSDRLEWLDEPPGEPWQGVIIANEVIDALPVERFRISGGKVQQLLVGLEQGRLCWLETTAPDALKAETLRVLGGDIADGYSSEICTMLPAWLSGLTGMLERGCALFVDYGYPRREYYSPQRSMGTLVCHYRHRGHDDAFFYPGLQDISAFVDFTALAEASSHCGLECSGYTNQAMFLFGSGLEQALQELEQMPDRKRLEQASQVRQLTMPGIMGEKFQVMALSRNLDIELRGFGLLDLRHRL